MRGGGRPDGGGVQQGAHEEQAQRGRRALLRVLDQLRSIVLATDNAIRALHI